MIHANPTSFVIEKLKPIRILIGHFWFRLIQGFGAVQNFA
jgi:hypothetical protein